MDWRVKQEHNQVSIGDRSLLPASLLFFVPALHPLLQSLVGVPSHLLWWVHVLPVALFTYVRGRAQGAAALAVSTVLLILGERLFGLGYGNSADWETVASLAIALTFTNLLVGGFATFARDSERTFRALVNEAPIGILRVAADGRVRTANPLAAELIRRVAPQSENWNFNDVLVGLEESDSPVLPSPDGHAAALKGRVLHRVVRLRADAATQYELTAVLLDPPREEWQVLVRDVTERNRLEAELRQAQKMDAIGRFAGGVAHDFNNMLAVILVSSEMAAAGLPESDERFDHLEEIRRAAERAALLTRRLLTFSRREVVRAQALDPGAVIGGLETMLQRLLPPTVHLSTFIGADTPALIADLGHMEQILLNLVVNANDAMPAGGTISIAAGYVDDETVDASPDVARPEGGWVRISVTDSGQGMEPAMLERIFEPFFTSKGPGEGTGLGLATVKELVQKWSGFVKVESQPGIGSTFHLYLPASPHSVTTAVRVPREAELVGGTQTVLVAEDEADVRRLLRRLLEQLGYIVLEARHGRDALLAADRHPGPIDLVITDVIMPEMGGVELAETLAARYPSLRVVFISGYAGADSGSTSFHHPGAVFLRKPFTSSELASAVRDLLDSRAAV